MIQSKTYIFVNECSHVIVTTYFLKKMDKTPNKCENFATLVWICSRGQSHIDKCRKMYVKMGEI